MDQALCLWLDDRFLTIVPGADDYTGGDPDDPQTE